MRNNKHILFITIFLLSNIFQLTIIAQQFTLVADNFNPIVTAIPPSGYSGATWVDYNNDNHLDLFINNSQIFKNTGNGTFISLNTNIGDGTTLSSDGGNGNSWADVDNDGDLDVYISGVISYLYLNEGNDSFSRVTVGDISNGFGNRGWSCAFGDYDNDGLIDLAITHPAGFVGSALVNHLLKNNGEGSFSKISNNGISTGFQPYTVGTWSDFDNDGDLDYSVGSGPANGTNAADFFYKNNLTESGEASFERIQPQGPGTDLRDGQVWNWIDYDNDGDLDVYITNWGGNHTPNGLPNDLYRNDNGSYTKITLGEIVQTSRVSLASVWSDFDNDGDLDCYVSNDRNDSDSFYKNNGDGTFTSLSNNEVGVLTTTNKRSASAGDYDNDGKIDLITVGSNSISLFKNNTQNDNNWTFFRLGGKVSNRAGIGAKVRLKAEIFGQSFWQMREVSAQNSFNSHNDLRVHFGLGDAPVIDSLIIEWPSGQVDIKTDFHVNDFWVATEGESITAIVTNVEDIQKIPTKLSLEQNYPNPFNPSTVISYQLSAFSQVSLKIFDVLSNEVSNLVNSQQSAGAYKVAFNADNLPSGIYFYQLQAGNSLITKKMSLLK